MGGPMAKNLIKNGYPMVVFDVNKSVADSFKSNEVRVASTPQEVASKSSIIVTMLPSSPHVQSVYSGRKKSSSHLIFNI